MVKKLPDKGDAKGDDKAPGKETAIPDSIYPCLNNKLLRDLAAIPSDEHIGIFREVARLHTVAPIMGLDREAISRTMASLSKLQTVANVIHDTIVPDIKYPRLLNHQAHKLTEFRAIRQQLETEGLPMLRGLARKTVPATITDGQAADCDPTIAKDSIIQVGRWSVKHGPALADEIETRLMPALRSAAYDEAIDVLAALSRAHDAERPVGKTGK
jgi:hypothetical protein